jgi:fatty acid desaturase
MGVTPGHPSNPEMYFCPNGDRTLRLGRKDFPEEKKLAIRALQGLEKRWNFVVLLHYAIWLGCGWVAITTTSLILEIAAIVMAGISLSALSVLLHEASHDHFTRNPKIDRWIGFICGLPLAFSGSGYRVMHPLHHRYLRTPEDPDDIENLTRNVKLLRFLYTFLFFFGVSLYIVVVPAKAVARGTRAEKIRVLAEVAAILAIVAAGWIFLPAPVMVKAWLLPLLVGGQVANMRGIAEHGMTTPGNELINARTVTTNPVFSFLMCNINYHLDHHLYPGIPWYKVPRVNAILEEEYAKAGSSVYRSYVRFLGDFVTVLKRGVVPGMRLVPDHVRKSVCP